MKEYCKARPGDGREMKLDHKKNDFKKSLFFEMAFSQNAWEHKNIFSRIFFRPLSS
jgi:hypothetical protein